ncbi:unnamed protein product, partial [Allacma fusca]
KTKVVITYVEPGQDFENAVFGAP